MLVPMVLQRELSGVPQDRDLWIPTALGPSWVGNPPEELGGGGRLLAFRVDPAAHSMVPMDPFPEDDIEDDE